MSMIDRIDAWPLEMVQVPGFGQLAFRSVGKVRSAQKLIALLHGIGSTSGSWLPQLEFAQKQLQNGNNAVAILAWDAPGYGSSDSLASLIPNAAQYGQVLWAALDALLGNQSTKPSVHLIGHSLGCIMAGAAALLQPHRVTALTLLSPAQGFLTAPSDIRDKTRQERLTALDQLGARGVAQARGGKLVAESASDEVRAAGIELMARIRTAGYTQAVEMLANANLTADLLSFKHSSSAPIKIACGDQDVITPPKSCFKLAQATSAEYIDLGAVGHLVGFEAVDQINTLVGL